MGTLNGDLTDVTNARKRAFDFVCEHGIQSQLDTLQRHGRNKVIVEITTADGSVSLQILKEAPGLHRGQG